MALFGCLFAFARIGCVSFAFFIRGLCLGLLEESAVLSAPLPSLANVEEGHWRPRSRMDVRPALACGTSKRRVISSHSGAPFHHDATHTVSSRWNHLPRAATRRERKKTRGLTPHHSWRKSRRHFSAHARIPHRATAGTHRCSQNITARRLDRRDDVASQER